MGVEGAHDAPWRVRADVVGDHAARHDEFPDQRRRRGDAVLAGQAAADAGCQIDLSAHAETRTGLARRRIERDQARVEGAQEDALVAGCGFRRAGIDAVGDTAAGHEVQPLHVDLRIEAPALGPRRRVECDHAVSRRTDVERVLHQDRRVLEGGADQGLAAVIDVPVWKIQAGSSACTFSRVICVSGE